MNQSTKSKPSSDDQNAEAARLLLEVYEEVDTAVQQSPTVRVMLSRKLRAAVQRLRGLFTEIADSDSSRTK